MQVFAYSLCNGNADNTVSNHLHCHNASSLEARGFLTMAWLRSWST